MSEPAPRDDRFDLDVGAYAHAVLRRWWLVLLLALVGAVTGAVWWYAQPKTYEATAAVYLGQPTDANGNAIVGVNSNPRAAGQIIQGNDVIQEAAGSVAADEGMTARQIRRGLTIETPTVTVKSTSAPTNYVAITVRGRSADKSAAAANALADILVSRLSVYSTEKTALLEERLAADEARLKQIDRRLAVAESGLQAATRAGSPQERAIAAAPYLTIIQAAGEQRSDLEEKISAGKLALVVVRDVETPATISSATPADEPARSGLWLSVLAGVLVGIVAGLIAVAFLMRRRTAAA